MLERGHFLTPLSSLPSRTRENYRQHEPRDKDGHADELRGRESEMVVGVGVVAAKVFDERARDGVADEVGRKDLAVKFLAPQQPGEENVKAEVQQRIVNFRRMHWRGWRMQRIGLGKSDGPRQIAGAAVAAAVQQAADAPEDAAERDARCQHIGDFPQRQFFPAEINPRSAE